MRIVTIIPINKADFRENLTYFSARPVPDGSLVEVPFRSKKILGLVVDSVDASGAKGAIKGMNFNLRKITEVKEDQFFKKEYLESALDMCKYFVVKKNVGVATLIPAILRNDFDKIAKYKNSLKKKEKISEKNLINTKTSKQIFQAPLADRISFYKTFIRENFAESKSVFIVLPTEFDIKNFETTLGKGIEQFTVSLSSSVKGKQALKKIEQVLTGEHPLLILGTAPMLAIPRADIGAIILEHESSHAYKMVARPYFDLRILAEIFAKKTKAQFILADTLLSLEILGRRELDSLPEIHPFSFKWHFEGKIEIENTKPKAPEQTKVEKKFQIFTDATIEEIKTAISKKKKIFIFALRKGLSTQTVCRDCGDTVVCEHCAVPMVLYNLPAKNNEETKRLFICSKCASQKSGDTPCAHCGSWNLLPLGIGTDTVYEELKKIFKENKKDKNVKIFKLDKDSVKTAKEAEKIIKDFEEEGAGSILVGTEMAFFYLQNKVHLAVVSSFDSLWSIPNFKIGEKIIQIASSLIERTEEKLIIQTKNTEDSAIQSIRSNNLVAFVREELEERKNLGYPPYETFIKISHLGESAKVEQVRSALANTFREFEPQIFAGFTTKIKGKYSTNALIKIKRDNWSLPDLLPSASIDDRLHTLLASLPSNFSVSINPDDLL